MEKQSSRLFGVIFAVVALVALAIVLQPKVEERLAPRLHTAWVGIEVAGSGVAEVGPVDLTAGDGFTLHAVLEARDRQDRPVYYTEAPALSFGGRRVAAESLRSWDRPMSIKVRWFTVEGERPYVALDAETGIAGFGLREFLRSDWPVSWSVPGEIDAANDNHLAAESVDGPQRFGTQRYHVRIELYRDKRGLIPDEVVRSWGVAELKTEVERFPTVRMTLPGAAATASRVFGLTELEPPPAASRELMDQIEELAAHDVAYSRLTILRDQIRQAGVALEDLSWTILDLAGDARWGRDAGPGDLLRAGDRVVVLYRDRGTPGVIDYQDLCFDFVHGAAVRALDDVFIGTGNDVELASLGGTRTDS
jgi:hypothetical protein